MMRTKGGREHGQALILLVFAMTVVFLMGAVAVDLGLWISERRGAQTDADASALAGAWELLDFGDSDAQNQADAITKATVYLDVNEQGSPNEFVQPGGLVVDDSCYDQGRADGVKADVNHKTKALFSSIFNIVAPVPGAHAKACAGAATGLGSVLPFEIDDNPGPCFDVNEAPRFTSMCPIELGAQGGNPRGILDLQTSGDYCSDANGSGDIIDMIVNGASGNCFVNQQTPPDCDPDRNGPWYDCVAIQDGNPKKVLTGVETRLATDGLCDSNFGNNDGTDDFFESVELIYNTGDPYTSLYEARDCDLSQDGAQPSPRVVTIIVLENSPPSGNRGYTIVAFAGFYIAGCTPEGEVVVDESDVNKNCDTPGNGANLDGSGRLYVQDPLRGVMPRPVACHQPNHNPPGNPCATATPTPSPGAPTPTATPTPTPTPAPTPTPSPTPGGGGPPGHGVVWGRFVKLVVAGCGVGAPTDQTTVFSVSLVE